MQTLVPCNLLKLTNFMYNSVVIAGGRGCKGTKWYRKNTIKIKSNNKN